MSYKLQAFAGACVQPISGIANFRISAEHNYIKVLKDLLLLSQVDNASIMRVSTNLGPVSREVNTSRDLVRMPPILSCIQNDHISFQIVKF